MPPSDLFGAFANPTRLRVLNLLPLFTCLPLESLDRMALTARLEEIAKTANSAGDED